MLEYLWADGLRALARYYQSEFQLLSGTSDPEQYYTIAAVGESFGNIRFYGCTSALTKGIRIEIADYPLLVRHWIYPGESVELRGVVSRQRLEFLLQALTNREQWHSVISHFSMRYGSYTLYAHCD
jgi:hypothetical protein